MRRILATGLLALAACGAPSPPSPLPSATPSPPPSSAARSSSPSPSARTVDAFRGADTPDGAYELTGYIVALDPRACAPCTPAAACGPCAASRAWIADRDRMDDPGRLEVGFSITIPETVLHHPLRMTVSVSHGASGARSLWLTQVTPERY